MQMYHSHIINLKSRPGAKFSCTCCVFLISYFDAIFTTLGNVHNYNTRAAANQSYYLPRTRTSYGLFNIRFHGPKVWNYLARNIKSSSLKVFKDNIKKNF